MHQLCHNVCMVEPSLRVIHDASQQSLQWLTLCYVPTSLYQCRKDCHRIIAFGMLSSSDSDAL